MYKCSNCGSEDKLICGLVNVRSTEGPRRILITFCEGCKTYYFYEFHGIRIGGDRNYPIKRIELSKEEAMELIVKMKCCAEPKDTECSCPVHRFIDSFAVHNQHRVVAM